MTTNLPITAEPRPNPILRRRRFPLDSLVPLIALAVLIVIWELAASVPRPLQLIPPPTAIWAAIQRTAPVLANDIPYTLAAALIGLSIATVAGVLIAGVLDLIPLLKRALYPLLIISQTIPLVGIAALLLLIFGFDLTSKVAVVLLFCFFPIAVATLDGLAATDPDLVALLRAMGATRRQIWRMVRFPAALPSFFSGLRIAATYSVTGAVTGEFITAPAGLGRYLRLGYSQGKYDQVFAAIVLIALFSLVLIGVVWLIERAALPWFYNEQRRTQWTEPGIY